MKLIVKKGHAPILKTENFENSIFLKEIPAISFIILNVTLKISR